MFCRVGEKITLVKAGNHTGGKRMRAGSAGPVTRGEYQHKTGSTRQWKKGNFTCRTKRDNNHIWHISNQHRAVLILLWQFQDSEAVYRLSSQKNILHDGAKLTFVRDFSAETMHRWWEFNTAWKLFTEMGIFQGFQLNPCKMRVVHDGKLVFFSSPREAKEFHLEMPVYTVPYTMHIDACIYCT